MNPHILQNRQKKCFRSRNPLQTRKPQSPAARKNPARTLRRPLSGPGGMVGFRRRVYLGCIKKKPSWAEGAIKASLGASGL